jgi:hypothetical protein
MEDKSQNENVQRFPNKNLGQDIERDQHQMMNTEETEERNESDANPLRDGGGSREEGKQQGNSSIPMDEEDTLGIP